MNEKDLDSADLFEAGWDGFIDSEEEREQIIRFLRRIKLHDGSGRRFWHLDLEPKPKTRSAKQNALMWSMLVDIERQAVWVVNGVVTRMSRKRWKIVFSAAIYGDTSVANGLNGGLVFVGAPTSRMNMADMAHMIDLMAEFGRDRDIKWTLYNQQYSEEAFANVAP